MSEYIKEFEICRIARIGVIATRTREVERAKNMLQSYAATAESTRKPFYVWTPSKKWEFLEYSKTPNGASVYKSYEIPDDDYGGPIGELKAVGKMDADAVVVMIHPGVLMENPVSIDVIREYCHTLGPAGYTLVLLCADNQTIPPELEPDITVLDMELPDRVSLLDTINRGIGGQREFESAELDSLCHAAAGMTISEANAALGRAAAKNVDALEQVPINTLVTDVLNAKADIVRKSNTLELYKAIDMSNVGGLRGLKQWLRFNKVRIDPSILKQGADPLQGILLVGSPGTGKSLTAKSCASEFGIPLIRFNLGACFGGIVGESEAKTAATFKILKAMGSCVIWVDEIDKAGLESGANGDSGASSRILQTLLYEMQEMKTGAFWVFTANDVTKIPIELIRPGRLDEKFLVDIPGPEDRLDVLQIHLRKRRHSLGDSVLGDVVEASDGFIQAELEKLVVDSSTYCFNAKTHMTAGILLAHTVRIRPTSQAQKERFEAMRKWGLEHAIDASKVIVQGEIVAQKPAANRRPSVIQRPTITKR